MNPIEEIEQDLDWREAEMAVLRVLLSDSGLSEKTRRVLFRAAWALLYAHFEGFCKFALTLFYDEIKNTGACCVDLPSTTQAFALSSELKSLRNMPATELLAHIQSFEANVLAKAADFPEVDTESNLWPTVFERLLVDADITLQSLQPSTRSISTLVSRRNKIAHGERDIIPDFEYYLKFEEVTKTVMYDLALAIDEKLSI